jgi:hypothetical protein
MTLKNAALLALIGTILMTALLLWTFVFTFLKCPAGVGSSSDAVLLAHLCVWRIQRNVFLFRVPQGAVVMAGLLEFSRRPCQSRYPSLR